MILSLSFTLEMTMMTREATRSLGMRRIPDFLHSRSHRLKLSMSKEVITTNNHLARHNSLNSLSF